MQFSTADRALFVKIVYYGPGLSGKTSNLESIHRLTDPAQRQPMVSLKTSGDRTLFFDLLPFELGRLYGLEVRLKIYTVPGQIQYDLTRRQVLAGADGVVFVADSQESQRTANTWMLRFLKNNLDDNGLDPETIPLVFQWNKRDLPNLMSPEELARDLNWRQAPAFEAVATTGAGVLETFGAITAETIEALARRSPTLNDRTRAGEARALVEKLFVQIHESARRIQPAGPTQPERHDIHLGVRPAASEESHAPRGSLGLGELLNEALNANLRMSDRLVASSTVEEQASRTRRERRAMARLVQVANAAGASGPVLRMALTAAMAGMGASLGAVVVSTGRGRPLREIVLAGRSADPLNAVEIAGMGSLAASLLEKGEPRLVTDPAGELLFGRSDEALAGIRGLVAVPFEIELGPPAMMIVYNDSPAIDFATEDLEFAQLVAGVASLALRGLAARRGVGLTGPV
jgi:signal recognition particle receptor subunit beta